MTAQTPSNSLTSSLYEQDYYLWLENTVKLLQEGKLHELDRENLIEEIHDMGKRERRSIYSNLKILLMHLLKYCYQPEKRSNSWRFTIEEHRQRIREALEDSPSLKSYLDDGFDKAYQDARKLAAQETGLDINLFPLNCPFSQEDVLNSDRLLGK
jgi:hypothetical protein